MSQIPNKDPEILNFIDKERIILMKDKGRFCPFLRVFILLFPIGVCIREVPRRSWTVVFSLIPYQCGGMATQLTADQPRFDSGIWLCFYTII